MEYQTFNGIQFYQTTPREYFRHSIGHTTILMHKYVWEYYNGKIPKGYEVHHIDRNRANNDISNLQLLTKEEHKRIHAELLTDEEREWRRQNIIKNAVPTAIEWHKSEEGKTWHKEQAKSIDLHKERHLICKCCGKSFTTYSTRVNQYCSLSCKSKFRRKSGADNIMRNCVICGKAFMTNKNKNVQCCSKSCGTKLYWKNRETTL